MENTITIKELIEELKNYNENFQVMVKGLGEILNVNEIELDEEKQTIIIG
jgi:LEA14-like dessication related protein